jgi:hypothetical protein
MKIPLSAQIDAVEISATLLFGKIPKNTADALRAALSTLKWVERHQAELRVLGEFEIEAVTIREAGE